MQSLVSLAATQDMSVTSLTIPRIGLRLYSIICGSPLSRNRFNITNRMPQGTMCAPEGCILSANPLGHEQNRKAPLRVFTLRRLASWA